MLPVDVAQSCFDGTAMHYVLPVLRMSCFHTMEAMGRWTGMVLYTCLPVATGGAQATVGRPDR